MRWRRWLLCWGAAALALIIGSQPGFADQLDYSLSGYAPGSLNLAEDGTLFLDYANPTAGATYGFTMYVWVESGATATTFPTGNFPVEFIKLSEVPEPRTPGPTYTGIPGGSY